jgi:uncharacterized protein DUF6092
VSEESPLFDPLVYLVASARDCLDGPILYAALRMVETVSRLVEAMDAAGLPEDDFLTAAKRQIDEEKDNVMADRERFLAWLDNLLADFASEAKRRNTGRDTGRDMAHG